MRNRPIVLASAVLIGAVAVLACDHATHEAPACAKSGGGGGGGGGASSGGKSGGASSGGKSGGAPAKPPPPPPPPYRPPPPGARPKPETNVRNQSKPETPRPRDNAARDRARAESRRPNVRPRAEDYDDARATAPTRLSRGGAFTSPVTNIEYHYHDLGWYSQPGYLIDLYDPYDRYNHWYRPNSPLFGTPFVLAGDCDGHDEQTEQPINVNVTVDQDGRVTGEVPATGVPPAPAAESVPPGTAPPT